MGERIYYAVGDVHGELSRLAALHTAIDAHWRTRGEHRPATVVHLGDYVDRGPDSFGVVDYLMRLERSAEEHAGWEIVCLLGNHERMMIDALESQEPASLVHWAMNGGDATLASYRRRAESDADVVETTRPHVEWMKTLPTQLLARDAGLLFVHAGIDPATFPDCSDEVRLWTRSKKFFQDSKWPKNEALGGLVVVHGHTPTDGAPYLGRRRINLDTGAVYGGPLTGAAFLAGRPPEILSVPREAASRQAAE